LRYTPALTVPELNGEAAAGALLLTCLAGEDEELAGWVVCARIETLAHAVIPRIVIPRIRISSDNKTLPRATPLMFRSYKDIFNRRFSDIPVR
jgi:hypothetical protein